jgi:adenosylcobinamide-phosphate synthase
MMYELTVVIFVAFLADLLIGDPRYRYHPVRIIGRCIAMIEATLRSHGLNGKLGGLLLLLAAEIATLAGYLISSLSLRALYPLLGLGFDIFICYSCLALKDLLDHVRGVIHALEVANLPEARQSISLVVGRDVRYLDEEGVCRAAVETLAENFVDGFFSPIFWYVVGGLAGFLTGTATVLTAVGCMLAFKVVSTLDSMVGYKTPEFLRLGWAGARMDDLMNFIPARLSLIILFGGAWFSGLKALEGLRVAMRDRLKHDSPNSAHAESFAAGALGINLGGSTRYPEGLRDRPWLGDGAGSPGPGHIRQAARLLRYSAWMTMVTAGLTFLAYWSLCLFLLPDGLSAEPPARPQRIVSLAPTTTENIYLLGAGNRLIGNTVYCVTPSDAKHKVKVGTVLQANIEKIRSLNPDLVVVSSLVRPKQLKKMARMGIPVVKFPYPKDFSEICQHFLKLGRVLGESKRAREIIDLVQGQVAAIRERTARLPMKKVFVQIGIKPLHTVSGESFLNDYILFSGGTNIAVHEKSGIYSREKVLQLNPDVVIIATMGIAGTKEKEAWMKYGSMAAVKNDQIYIVDPDKICSPTPVTFVEGLREMAKIIHPELELAQ